MPHPKNVSFLLIACLCLALGTSAPAAAEAEGAAGRAAAPETTWSRLWRGVQWVGFASVEVGWRRGVGAGGPPFGVYVRGETAGYGRAFGDKYRLVVAFDSRDKGAQEMLTDTSGFQYPVLGDAGSVHADAPSRGPIYLRVERDASYFLYGDYRTELAGGRLLVYDRRLTGPKLHYEKQGEGGRWRTTLMGARSGQVSKTERFPSLGTVGYYRLSEGPVVPGSERIHVQAAGSDVHGEPPRRLRRDVDYTIDYVDGAILLREPIPIADLHGNVYEIIVIYEYEPDGVAAATYAGRVAYDAATWRLGLTYVEEGRIADVSPDRNAFGVDGGLAFAPWLQVEAEWSESASAAGGQPMRGDAYRLQLSGDLTSSLSYQIGHQHQSPDYAPLHADVPAGAALGQFHARLHYEPTLTDAEKFFASTLAYDGQRRTPPSAADVGLAGHRTTWSGVYGVGRWTVQGRLDSAHYAQLGAGVDRWTEVGYRLGASHRFDGGHELGAFRRGGAASSRVTGIEERTGVTGLHYDHRLDDRTALSGGYSVRDDGPQSLWIGLARRLVENDALETDVYTRWQMEGTMDETRAASVIGINNRWRVAEGVAVDFGYERSEGLTAPDGADAPPGGVPPGTPAGSVGPASGVKEAWNASISFAPAVPYRLALVYSTSGGDGGASGQHLRLSAFGRLADDWSGSVDVSASARPGPSGGGEPRIQRRQSVGLAYRPLQSSRVNGLLAYERIGTEKAAGGETVSQTYSAEASYWVTSAWELAGKIARRDVVTIASPAPEVRTGTMLYQVRSTFAFAPRWDGTFIYRTLRQTAPVAQSAPALQEGYQVSVGYAFVAEDPRWRLEAGYRYADFAPEDDPSGDGFAAGPFARLTYRF